MADQKDSRVTTEMLEKAVAEDQDVPLKDVQILKWSASAGAADGEGFSAEMLAVNVTAIVKGLFKDFSYMAKVVPENEMRAKMLKEVRLRCHLINVNLFLATSSARSAILVALLLYLLCCCCCCCCWIVTHVQQKPKGH
jgi:hypothetical protein